MSETFVQRVNSGVNDVARRVEIGLADLEMNNVAAPCLERFRFHQDFECGLSPETRHALGETKFTLCDLMHHGESSSSRRFSQLPTIDTQLSP